MHGTPRLRREHTLDLTEAQRSMSDLYGAPLTLAADPPRNFSYDMAAFSDEQLTTVSLRFNGSCRLNSPSFNDVLVAHAASGRHRWRVGPESGNGGVPFIVPPEREVRVEFTGLHLRSLRIPAEHIRETVRTITGRDLVRLRTASLNTDARHPLLVAETLRFIESTVLADDNLGDAPLVRAAISRQAVVAILNAFPLADLDDIDERYVAPAAVRRAAAFIDEHAHEPVTVGDLARAAGVSTRALQNAFQRAFDLSPSQYLRRVRLNGARRDLLESDPASATVGAIAHRWGFAHTGRFAQSYVGEYGELPSQTLRR